MTILEKDVVRNPHTPRPARHGRPKSNASPRRSRLAVWAGVALFCVVAAVPFLYLLSASLKPQQSLFMYPPQWVPDRFYLQNFIDLLTEYPFWRWTLNTLLVAGVVTLAKVAFDSMAAFAFAKLRFPGRRLLFVAMLSTVMIPPAVLIIPLYFLVRDIGWLDTYWALIIPPLANPIGIFMLRALIEGLPDELLSAARVDNCNEFQVYARVVVPLIKPGLVVVGTYIFLIQYTSFVWPLVATSNDPDMYVLTAGMASLKPQWRPDWGLISAGSILTMVPITAVFLLFQRQFLSTSLADAIKE